MIEGRHYSCDSASRRLAITARGVVQGVGFRPFVYNAARSNGLAGWVRNESGEVRITADYKRLAPNGEVFLVSAVGGEGIAAAADWLAQKCGKK